MQIMLILNRIYFIRIHRNTDFINIFCKNHLFTQFSVFESKIRYHNFLILMLSQHHRIIYILILINNPKLLPCSYITLWCNNRFYFCYIVQLSQNHTAVSVSFQNNILLNSCFKLSICKGQS